MEEPDFYPGEMHPSIFPLDKQHSVINSHKFRNVLKLSEIFAKYQTMGIFLDNLIDFINENILNGLLKSILSLAQDNGDGKDIHALVTDAIEEYILYKTGLATLM